MRDTRQKYIVFPSFRSLNLLALVIVASLAQGFSQTYSQEIISSTHDSSLPIEITADSLEVQQGNETAIFRGSVHAIQGNIHLKADSLTVHYNQGMLADKAGISRIDADGDVFFSSPSETAEGSRGVYYVNEAVITLSGSVLLTRGSNVIRGENLIHNLESSQSMIESDLSSSDLSKRVKGVFYPDTQDE